MSSPRPSWRPLLAGTVALFLVIFAFLAGQLHAGADPALGRSTESQQQSDTSAPAPAVPDPSSQAPSTHQS
jgi:hypothetical protein